jgi:4-amino-4-deoxy-L-arabinose transferase-like glycosyltransferase
MAQELSPDMTEEVMGRKPASAESGINGMESGWLDREFFPMITPARLLLVAILLLGLILYTLNIGASGMGNIYYSAAVKSMLHSWHNFFFLAAEPGGSVSVDKPPLGLWIQAGFASLLGLNGFALVLPSIIAGMLSVLLLYWLVKRHFGSGAGLLASLVLALTPVAVAVNRSNVLDGILTFFLLLAACGFIHAAESGHRRWLWLGALFVGLAFNVKMLQAYLALPAFFGLYFLGADRSWRGKAADLLIAFLIILVVSLSWAQVVDLTPPDRRPYIGGSADNSVFGLIAGYNGIMRIFGPHGGAAGIPPTDALLFEIGEAGWSRLITPPLGKEMSWLLPLALLGTGLGLISSPLRMPLKRSEQRGALLWGSWLLTGLVFFSLAGFFHAYYLATLAPPLGAGVGMAVSLLWRDRNQEGRNALLLAGIAAVTLGVQIYLAVSYGVLSTWVYAPLILILSGVFIMAVFHSGRRSRWLQHAARGFILASVVLIPLAWSILTALDENPHGGLPGAFQGSFDMRKLPQLGEPGPVERRLIDYVSERTGDSAYLLAVPSAQQGALIVLETGRPVLYMGGFNGQDPVIDPGGLAEMVGRGELRFVLYSREGRWRDAQIGRWLDSACEIVPEFSSQGGQRDKPPPAVGEPSLVYPPVLYDCGE